MLLFLRGYCARKLFFRLAHVMQLLQHWGPAIARRTNWKAANTPQCLAVPSSKKMVLFRNTGGSEQRLQHSVFYECFCGMKRMLAMAPKNLIC